MQQHSRGHAKFWWLAPQWQSTVWNQSHGLVIPNPDWPVKALGGLLIISLCSEGVSRVVFCWFLIKLAHFWQTLLFWLLQAVQLDCFFGSSLEITLASNKNHFNFINNLCQVINAVGKQPCNKQDNARGASHYWKISPFRVIKTLPHDSGTCYGSFCNNHQLTLLYSCTYTVQVMRHFSVRENAFCCYPPPVWPPRTDHMPQTGDDVGLAFPLSCEWNDSSGRHILSLIR